MHLVNVPGVEVVIVDEVGLEEDSLDDEGQVVRAVHAQRHLPLGDTGEAAPPSHHDVVQEPRDEADAGVCVCVCVCVCLWVFMRFICVGDLAC